MMKRKRKSEQTDYVLAYVMLYTYAGDKACLLGVTVSIYNDTDRLDSMILKGLAHG
jgi:hypothetical protein